MSFSRVSISNSNVTRDFKNRVVAVATYEPARSQSNRRLFGTVISLLLGLGMLYVSSFYIPAFFNAKNVVGFSSKHEKLPVIEAEEERSVLAPYIDMFKLRRGYFRAGQAIHVRYSLSPGQTATLSVKKCYAPTIIEIFNCTQLSGQDVTITGSPRGARSFVVANPGFYYFDDIVTENGAETTQPFFIEWTRVN